MIVINKTSPARPLVLGRPTPKTVTGLVQFDAVVLKPGSNEIDSATADVLKTSATAQEWVKRGWVKALPAKKEGPGLGAFEDDMAMELVSDCFDVALLARWKEGEKREAVRVSIVERVAALKAVADEK